MAEDTRKKKSLTRRHIKSFKDINRELRAKLSNINNSLLAGPIKERRSHSSDAKLSSSLESTSLEKVAPRRLKTPKYSQFLQKANAVTGQKKEMIPHSPRKPKISKKSSPRPKSPSSTTSMTFQDIDQEGSDKPLPQIMNTVSRPAFQDEHLMYDRYQKLSTSSKKVTKSKLEVRRPKVKKIYTEEQLRRMINQLYKETKDIRAKDPEVEKLLEETRESIQAIETLEKLFQQIHDESKARTKRLLDEFEKLKTAKQQHGRDLDAQIAQQVRIEVDTKKELSDMLNDATMKMIMAKSGKKKDPVPQRSFFVNMMRSAIGI